MITKVIKIKLVKPEKAAAIENSLIGAAQQGMLKNRISEGELIALLERESAQKGEAKVTVLPIHL